MSTAENKHTEGEGTGVQGKGLPYALDRTKGTPFDFDPFLGRLSYSLTLSNIIFSVYLVSVRPWDYWIWHSIKNFLYVLFKFAHLKTMKWQWWLADFCYVVNYLSWIYFLTCYLKANFESFHFLREYLNPLGPLLFRVAFIWSNGILAGAISLFHNELILHSPIYTSSVAIHIGPPIVTWAFRWFSAGLNEHWPDTFHTDCTDAQCDGSVTSLLLYPALCYVLLWTIPYVTMLFFVFEPSIKAKECVTMFSHYRVSLFGSSEAKDGGKNCMFAFLRSESRRRTDGSFWIESERVQQFVYMSMHGILSFLSFGIAYMCWHSFKFNSAYLIFQLHVSIWNGSGSYFYKTRTLIEETNKEIQEKKAQKQQLLREKEKEKEAAKARAN